MNILQELRERFAHALSDFTNTPQTFAEMVKPSQDARHGDFQANCAMPLAKQHGTNPRELALKIIDRLDVTDLCTQPEIAGPGFINLALKDDVLTQQTNSLLADDRLGVAPVANPKNIILDFSSPNVAKPMHVGHLRSSVIGDSLQRTLKFLGHNVQSDNHIGDWGTQFGMIIYGYKYFRDDDAYANDPVGELARLYRLVNQLCDYHEAKKALPEAEQGLANLQAELELAEAEADPDDKKQKKAIKKLRGKRDALRGQVASLIVKINGIESNPEMMSLAVQHPDIVRLSREETAKLHAGDTENKQLWDQFLPQCLDALQRVYDRLDIQFDMTLGESFYNPYLAEVVEDLEKKEMASESQGAKCVFLEGNAAPFIVQKSDGAFTYATTDLATIKYRVDEFQADAMLYVVDARQSEHFQMLFETARMWGFENLELQHVSFGTVMGQDKRPYKTRSGDTVGLESLLDEAVRRAKEIVQANNPDGTEEDWDRTAEIVGIGGIKYADLHHNRESDYVFDWDKMLATTGDTATYMQYAYARIHGIFRKGEIDPESVLASDTPIELAHEAERALALKLCRFDEALLAVEGEYRPNLLTQYLYELAGLLTKFYDACPVLKAETEESKISRLKLVWITGRVIKQGLELLGIQVSERM